MHFIQRLLRVVILIMVAPAMAQEVVVIGHPSQGSISKERIADIFLGKDPSMTPVDLPESSPLRAAFYKKATGRDPAQVKAVWSRLAFTGKGQPPKEFPDAVAVKKAVAADPKLLGYIEKAAVDSSVKVLGAVE